MNRVAKRAGAVLLLVAFLVAGLAFFVAEYVCNAADWVVFPGSPHVYSAGNIGTGVITDRDFTILLDMQDGRTYSKDLAIRKSVLHWVGDRQGNISAPAVTSHSSTLAGFDLLNGVYSYGGAGAIAQLTLSAPVQTVALEAMGNKKGTVAVYNYKTGQLLCAVTTPTYDPDSPPDLSQDSTNAYEGVYLNRFTQSCYTPGSIYKIVTLGAALEEIPEFTEKTFTCQGSYAYGPDKITCESVHGEQSVKEAFRNSCNCAFAQIADLLGGDTLNRYVEKYRINQSVTFDGIQTAQGSFQTAPEPVNVAWSAIGQYTDLINPCAYLTFIGSVAAGGKGAVPYAVERIYEGSSPVYTAKTRYNGPIMDKETAGIITDYMRNNVVNKYGDSYFPGLTVCAKTGTAEKDGEIASTAMLAGFATDEEYPLAFIVCVEEGGYGAATCLPIASKVLSACKAVLSS